MALVKIDVIVAINDAELALNNSGIAIVGQAHDEKSQKLAELNQHAEQQKAQLDQLLTDGWRMVSFAAFQHDNVQVISHILFKDTQSQTLKFPAAQARPLQAVGQIAPQELIAQIMGFDPKKG